MRLLAQSHIANQFLAPTEIMAKVQVANAPGQTIVSETLIVVPHHDLDSAELEDGRLLRGTVEGDVEIVYRALVDLEPREEVHAALIQHDWSDLPEDVLPYLLPSRFCPADKFLRYAARQFGALTGGLDIGDAAFTRALGGPLTALVPTPERLLRFAVAA